jgi:hypothetical protein
MNTMEYMVLLYSDENFEMPAPGSPEFDAFMGEWMAYNQTLIDGGHFVSGASLAPTTTATTYTKAFGAAPAITDGPYVETKEQLGGYYLISAADLDEAIRLVEGLPIPVGSFEIRPVAFRPDAG